MSVFKPILPILMTMLRQVIEGSGARKEGL